MQLKVLTRVRKALLLETLHTLYYNSGLYRHLFNGSQKYIYYADDIVWSAAILQRLETIMNQRD